MGQHVKILAVLYIIFGVLGLIGVIFFMLVFGGAAGIIGVASSQDEEVLVALPIVLTVGIILSVMIAITTAPTIFAGIGMLKYRSWARILAIVLSGLDILKFPFGTAIGVYGLWVLLSDETVALFKEHGQGN